MYFQNSELERSTITVGGGCIGEIWRVNMKRSFSNHLELTDDQKQKAKLLWQATLNMRQSDEEKTEITFSGLRMRDRQWGNVFPKGSSFPLPARPSGNMTRYFKRRWRKEVWASNLPSNTFFIHHIFVFNNFLFLLI